MLGIVTELEAIKANNNGKLPYYGAITNMVKAQKVYFPSLTNKKVDYWLPKAGASAVPNMGILAIRRFSGRDRLIFLFKY